MNGQGPRILRLAMSQINTTVGDLEGNKAKIIAGIERARDEGADLVTFPELCLPGYPPEDLLLKPQFIAANLKALRDLVKHTRGITAVIGFVDRADDIFNSAAVAHNGEMVGIYHKMYLPNYGVFDEIRYFQAGTECPVYVINGVTVGITICEDIWYPDGPALPQALLGGAEVIVNISSSPYHAGKGYMRERMLSTRASDGLVIVAYNNLVGGQDELVFDGHSLIFDENGNLIAQGKQFEEDFIVADLNPDAVFRRRLHDPRRRQEKARYRPTETKKIVISTEPRKDPRPAFKREEIVLLPREAEIYKALVIGTRDYVTKNGFKTVVIGLSGGIDSAITATIAVDALGRDQVVGVSMPSEYSSRASVTDAQELAENLGIRLLSIPIQPAFDAFREMFGEHFRNLKENETEENIQARIRGNILMALSNKFGWLVLTTGNKSEISVGYCTLYGDMAGGFAVLRDVPKTLVYDLARYRNSIDSKGVIPQSIIDKPPSAELRPNQKDTDKLPPYDVLDAILEAYVEEDRSIEEIAEMGFDAALVKSIIDMVDRNEYKRRQGPPGIKITPRAFGRDRRMPITNRFSLELPIRTTSYVRRQYVRRRT